MDSTKKAYGLPAARVLFSLLMLFAVGIGLIQLRITGLDAAKVPEEVKVSAPISDDVLSIADIHEWRQEFLWHRNLRKICLNPWIESAESCIRIAQPL